MASAPFGTQAADLAAPEGDVLLTVTGAITNTNADNAARFDRKMLEALPAVTIRTSTIWTEGVQTFTGVQLIDLAAAVGTDADELRAMAVNDYAVTIPGEDWVDGGPIIAYLNNGAPMSLRDKGPLWVIYPYDSKPAYQSEVAYSRSIWQLDRIEME
ncbi:oxidoreductase [Pseudooceanicola sediminis]|uniref:Oxidoreductase n=1 Tax=Pseudooceanicola sediminis TaxID=2211117 RepID=A0A399J497_9RHOB|nr:oxidoreductase [Puniceibacterium sp. HSS470]RII40080.1 oxidoreductase [Pseudooceanicola sediminis]